MEHLPKSLRLWFYTRKYAPLLSGNVAITTKIQNEIYQDFRIRIQKKDIEQFPAILKSYQSYPKTFFRGVFLHDELYLQLKKSSNARTKRFWSCTKEINFAKHFGNKILLIINAQSNFDVSKDSREQEIILNRNVNLQLDDIKHEDGYEILFVSEINN